MTTTLIPESAPFSTEQRAWLNGFLAGWTGIDGPHDNSAAGLVAPQALESSASAPSAGEAAAEEEEFPWHNDSLPMDQRLELAKDKPLNRRLMAAMAQLDCGACGYVCKTYSEAIASGDETNLTLCAPGGKETAKMVKKLLKEDSPGDSPAPAKPMGAEAATSTVGTRANPYRARLKEVYNLNGPGSAKHTCHVVIDLAGSGVNYRVGDALGVFPTNCPELVGDILARLRFDRNNGIGGKLQSALLEQHDLAAVDEELVEHVLSCTTDSEEQQRLAKLLADDAYDELDVLDLLQLAPSAELDGAAFVSHLSPINPRLYSIASSQRIHTEEVHLTIGKVSYERGGRLRKGVASTMFADRLRPGQEVRIFVHESRDFTVPAAPEAPMIMVGPGTGIAPFRAFLEERQTTASGGRNWLFFGDQHEASDFLYREELEEMRNQGLLTRLDTAFSRDQDQKVYVQDRMREHGKQLFAWLEQGAYFFVCGDARRMAVDVDRTLHEVVATHGGRSAEQAAQYVNDLKAAKRYVRDVY